MPIYIYCRSSWTRIDTAGFSGGKYHMIPLHIMHVMNLYYVSLHMLSVIVTSCQGVYIFSKG